ncbi:MULTISPECIES: hypothetical protein [Rhodovulum]|uniref:Uncharacterized protein n=2 Tax=Rhodovulum TaxID=34008 RepID=A0A8E3AS29_9RHOB|nr:MULTISPECIES: hypothetical protein [Rhodovulum]PTW51784.1 hypothetical protein C8N38_10185 [Rhodovulum kholense]RAP42715.1 hypothetical protein BYZ73_03345 [Rhodovulum viride]
MDDIRGRRGPVFRDEVPGGAGLPAMLEMVLMRLAACPQTGPRARELGQLGFMQWLGSLPGRADLPAAARAAEAQAAPGPATAALDEFRRLLVQIRAMPPRPLDLALPRPCRRGGARARRLRL